MKRCTGCDEEKPLDGFRRNKRSRDGRTARCKACLNEQTRDWYERNLETNKAKRRVYIAENLGAVRATKREWTRKWRAENPDLARTQSTASSRQFRRTNPEYHREWYARNADKERARLREAMRQWRAANPEVETDRKRRYREANIDVVRKRERENTHRRRALKGETSRELAEHMEQLLMRSCSYCGATENITIDHIVPLSRGGKHEPANLAPACLSCNCSKGAKLLDEWLTASPSCRK